jgi:hypothetical protein
VVEHSPSLRLSAAYAGLELRIKGDGQRYKLIIRCDPGWDSVGHTLSFPTQPGWQTVRLSFSEFLPVFRAKTMRNADPINPQSIYSIQLMLRCGCACKVLLAVCQLCRHGPATVFFRPHAQHVVLILMLCSKFESDGALNDTFREGSFELPVQRISAYLEEPLTPRAVLVSSAGVTRPGRPGINVDEEPPAVRMNEMLGGILDFKLAGARSMITLEGYASCCCLLWARGRHSATMS